MYTFTRTTVLFLTLLMFSTASLAQSIWSEDFSSYSNGTDIGGDNNAPSGTDWTSSYGGSGYFAVDGEAFLAYQTNGEGVWTSEVIDISSSNYVEVNTYTEYLVGFFTSGSYVRMYFKLDGGPEVLFFERSGDFAWEGSATASRVLSGSTLQIVIRASVSFIDYVYLDDIDILQVPILYSRGNGSWNNGNTWSADDFSGSQVACGCTPTSSEVAIIGNDNIVNITADVDAAAVVVQNTGTLRWTGNADLNIASGLLDVQSGGSISNNGNNANVRFNNTFSASLANAGTITITDLELPVAETQLELSGNSSVTVLGDIDFQQDDIVLTNNLTSTLSVSGVIFNNDNSTLINNETLVATGNIQAGTNDDGNQITNSSTGTLSFSAISLNNSNLTINNSGVINQSGNFTSGTIDTGSRFNNLNGATWNWSYTGGAYDTSVNSIFDCTDGTNTVNYNGTGAQRVMPVTYSNVTFSGTGIKTTQGDLDIDGDLYITASARLNLGNDDISIAGNWTSDSDNANPFNEGTGHVIFDGGADQIFMANASEAFEDVTLSKGGGNLVLAADVQIDGTLTLTNGAIQLEDQEFVISSTGNISGGSSSSFIVTNGNGRLTQNNLGSGGRTGDILFPVGTSEASYTPLTINNSAGTADNYSVRLISSIYDNGYSGTIQTSDVVNKTWFIDEAVVGGSDVSLTFQWNSVDQLSGFDPSMVRVIHYDGSGWEAMSSGAASGVGPYTMSASGVTSFSPFGVEGENSVLPVELLAFNAAMQDGAVLLKWATASELNNDFFTIEKTTDLQSFEEVGTVKGKGTTEERNDYQLYDHNPSPGVCYYRLKQTDFDGTYTYSDIVKVNNIVSEPTGVDLNIYPVPNKGEFLKLMVFGMASDSEKSIMVLNIQGQVVHQESVVMGNNEEIVLNFKQKLAQGIYTVRVQGSEPLVKQFTVN